MPSDSARDTTHNVVLILLDVGLRLVRTVRRLDPGDEEYAKCLKSAKDCSSRIEEELWKFSDRPETFNHLTTNLERLNFEISALG
jgi:hypothetical protein